MKQVQDDIIQRNKDLGQWSNQMFHMGEHYNVFQDLFREGYFHPQFKMNIEYTQKKDSWPVHCGSVISSQQVKYDEKSCDSHEHCFFKKNYKGAENEDFRENQHFLKTSRKDNSCSSLTNEVYCLHNILFYHRQ